MTFTRCNHLEKSHLGKIGCIVELLGILISIGPLFSFCASQQI